VIYITELFFVCCLFLPYFKNPQKNFKLIPKFDTQFTILPTVVFFLGGGLKLVSNTFNNVSGRYVRITVLAFIGGYASMRADVITCGKFTKYFKIQKQIFISVPLTLTGTLTNITPSPPSSQKSNEKFRMGLPQLGLGGVFSP
jgi:hypothetical protein